jgi:hypothetical protein
MSSGVTSPRQFPGTPAERGRWFSVLGRMLLVVLPAQLLGTFLAITALSATGALRDRPGLSVLITVAAGVVTGVGLGLVLRPARHQLVPFALLGAGVGMAVFVALLGVAQLRLPAASARASFGDFLLGALVVAAVQTAVALALWLSRSRNRTSSDVVGPA